MLPRLGEVLYWAACWIAVIVALLATAAWATDTDESWVGVRAFFGVSLAIWTLGRLALAFSRERRPKLRRR